MSSSYEIIKYHCDNYACIVIPTFVNNPLEKINVLTARLQDEQINSGRILFDFIVSSGDSKERYASVLYDNGFVYSSFEYVDVKLDDPIRKMSSDFLRMAIEKTGLPMLSGSQISLLKRGFNI